VTNHSLSAKRYKVFTMHEGKPHERIADYSTLDKLRRHQPRTDVIELVQIKPRMYVSRRVSGDQGAGRMSGTPRGAALEHQ
jgi:hypothetical protein